MLKFNKDIQQQQYTTQYVSAHVCFYIIKGNSSTIFIGVWHDCPVQFIIQGCIWEVNKLHM